MSAATPTRGEVLSLLRTLLRVGSKFTDYNVREYVKRRSLDAFRENKSLSDPAAIAKAFAEGKSQLEIARRQAVVYSLYPHGMKSVMEVD